MARRSRRLPLAAVALALVAWPVLGVAGAASAHSFPVDETPAADSTLTTLPDSFSVTMNEPLLSVGGSLGGFALEVQDAAGRFYGGCPSVSAATLSIPAELGEAGKYRVTWQVVSSDGHTVSDSYDFTWQPASGQPVSAGSATAPACESGSAATPPASDGQPARDVAPDAALGDVLWVGGVLVAVAAAVAITLVVVGRRKGGDGSPDAASGPAE